MTVTQSQVQPGFPPLCCPSLPLLHIHGPVMTDSLSLCSAPIVTPIVYKLYRFEVCSVSFVFHQCLRRLKLTVYTVIWFHRRFVFFPDTVGWEAQGGVSPEVVVETNLGLSTVLNLTLIMWQKALLSTFLQPLNTVDTETVERFIRNCNELFVTPLTPTVIKDKWLFRLAVWLCLLIMTLLIANTTRDTEGEEWVEAG